MKQAESGRSLIEMLAVIGIIGVLSVGVITGVRWGLVSGGSFSLQADVESAAQQLQELCAWSNGWRDCSFTTDDIQEILPEDLTYSYPGDSFSLASSSVPVRVCRRLMNPLYTNWNEDLIERVVIDNCSGNDYCQCDGSGCYLRDDKVCSNAEGSCTEVPWDRTCGSSSMNSSVEMKFYVVK